MENFELLDKSFTFSKITAYSLTMEIDYNHIAYTIVDHIRHKFVALVYKEFDQQVNEQNFLDVVDNYIKGDQYLQKHYKQVDFIFPSSKFVLVPEEFFDKKSLKIYFEQGNELSPGEEIQFNYIPEIKSYLLFAISSTVTNFFVYRFPEINFYHQGIPLIKTYSAFSKQSEKILMAVNFRKDLLMDALVMNNGELLLYNIFDYEDTNDNFYKIMRILKDFGYDARVELLGNISPEDDIYKLLAQYIRDLGFASLQHEYSVSFDKPIEIHRFANLFYVSD